VAAAAFRQGVDLKAKSESQDRGDVREPPPLDPRILPPPRGPVPLQPRHRKEVVPTDIRDDLGRHLQNPKSKCLGMFFGVSAARAQNTAPIPLKISVEKRYIRTGERQGQRRNHRKTAPLVVRQAQEKSRLSFWRQVGEQEQQGQINTDWLTADWHEKPKPKRRRRNVLPEAYRQLAKSERQQVRAAAKWIRQRVSLVDWGRKMPDADAGKPVPKPVNLKDHVVPHLRKNWRSGVRKLTLTAIIRHLVNDDTAYFTANSLGDETLLMIDVDCHATGTLEGATQFAEFLREHCFPNLYYEVSTHGNGIQGFVVVDRRLWKDAEYKAVLVDVEKWLRRVLSWTPFDVEDVELKGMPLVVSWGERKGEVKSVTFGSLAKMPRDWRRFSDWLSTTRMTPHDLRELPKRFAVPEDEAEPEAQAEATVVPEVVKGSVSGKLVDPDEIRKLEPLARDLLGRHAPEVSPSSRAAVVAEDVQVALAIIRSCTLNMNPDGSMPLARIEALWDAAYLAGDTTRAFRSQRFAAIRNMLSEMGLLEWEDATYMFGKACRWKANEELMGMIEEALGGTDPTTPFALAILVRNKIEESRQKRPEQVGLRPKKVFPSLLRTDWDEKLTEAGLDHLSRMAA